MFKIELTAEQRKNLLIFLGRTQLAGSEALAFVEINHKILEAKEDLEPKKPIEALKK